MDGTTDVTEDIRPATMVSPRYPQASGSATLPGSPHRGPDQRNLQRQPRERDRPRGPRSLPVQVDRHLDAAAPAATEWAPRLPVLISGSGATFDLTTTLPTSVKRGGVFGIDSSGQRLPAGMSLSARGLLAVGTAAIGSVAGVIFTYDAP